MIGVLLHPTQQFWIARAVFRRVQIFLRFDMPQKELVLQRVDDPRRLRPLPVFLQRENFAVLFGICLGQNARHGHVPVFGDRAREEIPRIRLGRRSDSLRRRAEDEYEDCEA